MRSARGCRSDYQAPRPRAGSATAPRRGDREFVSVVFEIGLQDMERRAFGSHPLAMSTDELGEGPHGCHVRRTGQIGIDAGKTVAASVVRKQLKECRTDDVVDERGSVRGASLPVGLQMPKVNRLRQVLAVADTAGDGPGKSSPPGRGAEIADPAVGLVKSQSALSLLGKDPQNSFFVGFRVRQSAPDVNGFSHCGHAPPFPWRPS